MMKFTTTAPETTTVDITTKGNGDNWGEDILQHRIRRHRPATKAPEISTTTKAPETTTTKDTRLTTKAQGELLNKST